MKVKLFPLAEIAPGEMRPVTVDGLQVVITRGHDGALSALYDRCPHAGVPLSKGRLLGKIVGDDVGDYRLTDELVIRCPWHGYEFDVTNGRCLADPKRVRVRTYAATVEDGMVCVERRPRRATAASDERPAAATPTENGVRS